MGSSTAFSFEASHAPAAPTEESICACHLVLLIRPSTKDQVTISTIYIGHVRVTTVDFAQRSSKPTTSSVIVSMSTESKISLSCKRFSQWTKEHSVSVSYVSLSNSRPFENCSTKQSRFALQSIQQGSMGNQCLVPSSNFVEKCVRIDHRATLPVTFLRFPDLYDTS